MIHHFNPRSHEGSDPPNFGLYTIPIISIHAPARGATSIQCFENYLNHISIHAPARGATGSPQAHVEERLQFQSTLPRGERLCSRCKMPGGVFISIHAPARGATPHTVHASRIICISIHAPARGATHCSVFLCLTDINFNPRSREGSDRIKTVPERLQRISIHAPARGATVLIDIFFPFYLFQSTLPRGERHEIIKNGRTTK